MFKNNKKEIYIITIIVMSVIIAVLVIQKYIVHTSKLNKIKVVQKIVRKVVYKNKLPKDVLLVLTKHTLEIDINRYKNISDSSRALILKSIYKYSDKYKLNPLLVYAILATESSFKFWIKHSAVNIIVNKKHIKTRAIGIGAVIWEWWSKDLVENHIVEVKSDLFQIDRNIEATCYILNKNQNMPLLKGTSTKQESSFLRYFGGGSKNAWYVDRVNKVLGGLMEKELYK